MARLFLIDHSLEGPGGHHFDYSRCLIGAALHAGVPVTLATHRNFVPHQQALKYSIQSGELLGPDRDPWSVPATATLDICPLFRQNTYQPDSLLAGLQHLTRSQSPAIPATDDPWFSPNRWLTQWRRRRWRGRRERFVRQFAADLRELFRQQPLQAGDHVLLTTVSELELMALASSLARDPATSEVHWHVQFHYNLYHGRRPDYARQSELTEAVSACFLASMARLAYHSVHFYTTSNTLADQYNQLGVGQFNPLPYPVAPEFHTVGDRRRHRVMARPAEQARTLPISDEVVDSATAAGHVAAADPQPTAPFGQRLRVTCPGGVRREKQQGVYLQTLVDAIWDRHLATGQVQLVVQRGAARWPRRRPKLAFDVPAGNSDELAAQAIEYLPHPLPPSEYVKLIRETDIGLLYYDSQVYYSRRAGILGELMACGKPLIVSAGSWLADQLEPHNYVHVRQSLRELHHRQRWELNQLKYDSRNVPLSGGVVSCDQSAHPFSFRVSDVEEANGVAVEFDWHWPQESGSYIRLQLTQRDRQGRPLDCRSQTLGCPPDDSRSYALFGIVKGAVEFEFCLSNAFDDATANLRNLRVTTLESFDGKKLPSGRLGLIAADEWEIANCIDEMVEHYDHYWSQAAVWAPRWSRMHHPQRVLDELVSVDWSRQRAA